MKNKVAICIAGEMRYWEITKDIFNSFDADIFISTWDTNDRQDNYPYKFHGNNNMNMDIINSLDNLKEAEFLPKEIENKFTFNIPKYWYLIHRCNLLKTKQEVKKNFKYDLVLITRPDVLYDKSLLENLKKWFDFNHLKNYPPNHPATQSSPSDHFEICLSNDDDVHVV